MKSRTRFIRSVITAAKSETVEMPWTRGQTRHAKIELRKGRIKPKKSA